MKFINNHSLFLVICLKSPKKLKLLSNYFKNFNTLGIFNFHCFVREHISPNKRSIYLNLNILKNKWSLNVYHKTFARLFIMKYLHSLFVNPSIFTGKISTTIWLPTWLDVLIQWINDKTFRIQAYKKTFQSWL